MKTKSIVHPLLRFAFFATVITIARASDPSSTMAIVASAEHGIESAYLRTDAATLTEALKPLDDALAHEPQDPGLLYTRAFGYYSSACLLGVAHGEKADQIAQLENALQLLERVKSQPWQAEADAFESTVLGQLIGLKGGMAGMTLGPKSGKLIGRALKAAPGNPRVQLFRGISLLNTPDQFGGDPVAGTAALQKAVEIFNQPATGSEPGPHWGKADALAWLGIAKNKAGDAAGARIAWQQALDCEPEFAWVKFALLPGLDRKTGK